MTREEALKSIEDLSRERGFWWSNEVSVPEDPDTDVTIGLDGRFYASDLEKIAKYMRLQEVKNEVR